MMVRQMRELSYDTATPLYAASGLLSYNDTNSARCCWTWLPMLRLPLAALRLLSPAAFERVPTPEARAGAPPPRRSLLLLCAALVTSRVFWVHAGVSER